MDLFQTDPQYAPESFSAEEMKTLALKRAYKGPEGTLIEILDGADDCPFPVHFYAPLHTPDRFYMLSYWISSNDGRTDYGFMTHTDQTMYVTLFNRNNAPALVLYSEDNNELIFEDRAEEFKEWPAVDGASFETLAQKIRAGQVTFLALPRDEVILRAFTLPDHPTISGTVVLCRGRHYSHNVSVHFLRAASNEPSVDIAFYDQKGERISYGGLTDNFNYYRQQSGITAALNDGDRFPIDLSCAAHIFRESIEQCLDISRIKSVPAKPTPLATPLLYREMMGIS